MDGLRLKGTRNGLTLLEAEKRIDELEAAAVKAALLLAQTARHQTVVDAQTLTMLTCTDLLVDALFKEGIKHSEDVEEHLGHAMIAAEDLRKTVAKRGANRSSID